MKTKFILFLLGMTLIHSPNLFCQKKKKKNKIEAPSNRIDSISYAVGISIAKSFSGEFPDINLDQFNNGLRSKLAEDDATLFSDVEAQKIVERYFKEKQEKAIAKEKEKYSSVIQEGEDFLKNNAKNPSVTTLRSGLQYEIITAGNGPKPTLTDKVETHYHGTLLDGTVFDSSVDRGTPISFPVNGVIKGWTEALQLMPVGSKWKLYIPYYLAYGERGAGASIGPYSTLIFEVELISIN
ncbi:MAG: FKBP-type peptidyl-prolyl cis-trans isomerase [Bacteroidota bacterium]|nr:FKBP-type peptidyl-prolyl cis-trans isomerase [Bacteroidota bacterium]